MVEKLIFAEGKTNDKRNFRKHAREQLGNNVFSSFWLFAVLNVFLVSLISAGASELSILSIFITGPLSYGIGMLFLKQARDGQKMEIGDLFSGFTKDYFANFMIGLMTSIFTFLWMLLFIIPGVVKAYSYSFAYYIKIDNPEYNWAKCIKESSKLTDGHKFNLFCLDLSFIGWYLLGMLCLGVGTFWVSAYHNAAKAQMYKSIIEYKEYSARESEPISSETV